MPLLYDLGVGAYHLGVRCMAPWNPKAAAWVKGREKLWDRLEKVAPQLQGCLWMHCASVGEFEQGRPVLEAVKKERPDLPVLLTFFSPSGYEARKEYPLATVVEYLPPDNARNAERLQRLIAPKSAIFVKYEFWFHHLKALRKNNVPTFLISALFRKDQPFFHWYGSAWRKMLSFFSHILTQDEASRTLLTSLGMKHVSVGGDTRFDRVAEIVAQGEELPLAKAFAGEGPVLICGSTWPTDEKLLSSALGSMGLGAPKCIVVPHELHEQQLAGSEQLFPKPLARWSELEQTPADNVAAILGKEEHGTMLVDRMGLLARLYRYGRVAYVGGGFTDGIHSLLEAAAWGVPVIFGPDNEKFPEARGLIDAGAAIEVKTEKELTVALERWLKDPQALKTASEAARHYVMSRTRATKVAMEMVVKAIV